MVFIGIHCDDWDEAVKAVDEIPIEFPITNDVDAASQKAYGLMFYPTVYVIDKKGVLRDINPTDLEGVVQELLNE